MDGSVSKRHYYWLVYEWSNLYLVCAICNRRKASRFPVQGERANIDDDLINEQALLLDPCQDEPAEHLLFSKNGTVVGLTERGRVTIDILALNRDPLVAARKFIIQDFEERYYLWYSQRVKSRTENIRQLLNGRRAYTACIRQHVQSLSYRQEIYDALGEDYGALGITPKKISDARRIDAQRQQQKEAYSVENKADDKLYFSAAQRIERIEISNFKSIQNLSLDFPVSNSENECWLMLIGENGTGKSSILQAVGLALMGEKHCNEMGLDASTFVHKRPNGERVPEGFVKVSLSGMSIPITLRVRSNSPFFEVTPQEPKVLLLGYGSTRLLTRDESETSLQSKYIRVKNLFDPTARLNDAEKWLESETDLSEENFEKVKKALKDLLMLRDEDTIIRENGTVLVKLFDTFIGLRELSDGFQSILSLSTDIMSALIEKWQHARIEESEAVVLIDEIEVHLHPSWKMEIVGRLRKCFPRVTFLVTTHDPLCLKGLYDGEIVKLERDEEGQINPITDVPSVNDLRADQILTSFMFELPTTRSNSVSEKIALYSKLLGKTRKNVEEKALMQDLKKELSQILTIESSPTQQFVETAVKQVVRGFIPKPSINRLIQEDTRSAAENEKINLEIKRQLKRLFEGK